MTTIANRISNQTPHFDDNSHNLLGEKQAAKFLGVSISYLRKSRCEGVRKGKTPAPPFVRVDGRVFYRRVDLNIWLANLTSRQTI